MSNKYKVRLNKIPWPTPCLLSLGIFWLCGVASLSAYSGKLDHVFGDLKQGLLGSGGITEANADAIVDGLYNNLKCNGVRVPIDLETARPDAISAPYSKVIAGARSHKMAIYANPMFTGNHNLSDTQYAGKIISYANKYKPEYLGCFNESGLPPERIINIVNTVKGGLKYKPTLVGPDIQHVSGTEKKISDAALRNAFAIICSHNAANDIEATTTNWNMLKKIAGRPTWATENPRPWSELVSGQEIGVKAVVDADITGLVLYSAFPTSVDTSGTLTSKGKEIAKGIGARE